MDLVVHTSFQQIAKNASLDGLHMKMNRRKPTSRLLINITALYPVNQRVITWKNENIPQDERVFCTREAEVVRLVESIRTS
jgi:hypothetical protein